MMPNPFFIKILLLVLVGCMLPGAAAWAQEDAACDEARLDEANRFYDLGLFDEATDVLRPCLRGRLRPGPRQFRRREATQALRLMALSSYALRQPADSTRAWVSRLVRLERGYRADPQEDPLFFQHLVDELRPPRWFQKRWVQVGGALVVGGVVSYVLFRPGPEALPHPSETFAPPPGN